MCAYYDLKVTGTKADLIERLKGRITPKSMEILMQFQEAGLKVGATCGRAKSLFNISQSSASPSDALTVR
jgi:hypothetical protein